MLSCHCPYCGEQLRMAEHALGRDAKCTACVRILQMPMGGVEDEATRTVRFSMRTPEFKAQQVTRRVASREGTSVPTQSLPTLTRAPKHEPPKPAQFPTAKGRVALLAHAAFFSAVPVIVMPFMFPIPLVIGILAIRHIKRNSQYVGTGRALFAIACGTLGGILTFYFLTVPLFG